MLPRGAESNRRTVSDIRSQEFGSAAGSHQSHDAIAEPGTGYMPVQPHAALVEMALPAEPFLPFDDVNAPWSQQTQVFEGFEPLEGSQPETSWYLDDFTVKTEDDSAYVTGLPPIDAHEDQSLPRSSELFDLSDEKDYQPEASSQSASNMATTLLETRTMSLAHADGSKGKRRLEEIAEDDIDFPRPNKMPRLLGVSELVAVSAERKETLQFFLRQWSRRSHLPSDKELKDVASLTKLSFGKVAMWYGDNLKLQSQSQVPAPVMSIAPASTPNVDPALDALVKDYILRAHSKSCSPGKSAGRLICTWNCGYSTASRDAWERHEEKKQPQKFWICASCRDQDLDEGNVENPFITCRKDKFLPHASAIHPAETNPGDLRDRSQVHCTASFIRYCNFVPTGTDLPCNHYFTTWKERNDHYIAHFESDPTGTLDAPPDDPGLPGPSKKREGGPGPDREPRTWSKHASKSAPDSQDKSSDSTGGSTTRSMSFRNGSSSDQAGDAGRELESLQQEPALCLLDVIELNLIKTQSKQKFLALRYDPVQLERVIDGDLLVSQGQYSAQMPPLDKFPEIWQAGIRLTRKMGFRYIWIDIVCNSDSSKDSHEKIYQAADLIIVLGRSTEANQPIWHFTCDYYHLATVQTWAQQRVTFHHVEPLGQGAYSFVDKVELRSSQTTTSSSTFARKIVLRNSTHKKLHNRYLDEIEIMRRFNHPHIAQFVAAYYDKSAFNIIMSPVADSDLRQYLVDPGRFPELQQHLPDWFMSLAEALAYMHRMHCRHKDIKPANILISRGKVLLTDFGTSLDFSNSQSQSVGGAFMTPKYCAPEVAAQRERGRSADMFSLGCVYAEMITVGLGHSLEELHRNLRFNEGSHKTAYHQRISDTLGWLKALNRQKLSECQRRILAVTGGMLAKKPERRPTADQVVGKLCSKEQCDGSLNNHATCHCCPRPTALSNVHKVGLKQIGKHGFPVGPTLPARSPIVSTMVKCSERVKVFSRSLFLAKQEITFGLHRISIKTEVLRAPLQTQPHHSARQSIHHSRDFSDELGSFVKSRELDGTLPYTVPAHVAQLSPAIPERPAKQLLTKRQHQEEHRMAEDRISKKRHIASSKDIQYLRELIREKYRLDILLWSNRNVQPAMKYATAKSDGLLQEIISIVNGWHEDSFGTEEWNLASKIKKQFDAQESRQWLWRDFTTLG